MTIFTLSAFGFSGSAGPGVYERILDFCAGPNVPTEFAFARFGTTNSFYLGYSGSSCSTPSIINSGETGITRITGQPNGRLQLVRNGNEATSPTCDMAMGAYNTASRTATSFIGKSNFPNNDLLEGSVGEILMWNKTLSSTEMSFVYMYLNGKYFGCGPGGFGAHPACTACPVNTSSSIWYATSLSQCLPCPAGSSTEGLNVRIYFSVLLKIQLTLNSNAPHVYSQFRQPTGLWLQQL